MRNNYSSLEYCISYCLVSAIISKLNILPSKQAFHIHLTIIKIKNHKKITHISLKLKKKQILKKYNCMSKKFPKINVKFHSNIITHNQTNE